jgi:hypothetical protein
VASTFIRATELWIPTSDGSSLDLTAGIYGSEIGHFQAVSRGSRVAYGEGLAGRTWERGQPIVLKNLSNPCFNRRAAAQSSGLTCAVSLPIFDGDTLKAVLLLFCNDEQVRIGAIELWCAPEGESEIALVDGFFGAAGDFEDVTRDSAVPRGVGLAGVVWDMGMPIVLFDVTQPDKFPRDEAAKRAGFHSAIGWPCAVRGGGAWVMALLSARRSPIAGRFETWLPEPDGRFRLGGGFCESGDDLAARWQGPIAVPLFAEVTRTLVPALTLDLSEGLGMAGQAAAAAGLNSAVVLPILSRGRVNAVVVWYY